ncbi:lipid-A-disaccharide synthase [Asticcacaulis machinosus]|uniref:Lipid-A-disaccharide synthase n=1 Tax=Asticcacaulis machinosus TaxID=2984211 RepID=A0ABT5HEW4_9CAUL|nr:lipid-A-disaccharide synthase [Asticcacaulis machinosus]MDC7674795.1 lipid-A-disaccharide synthase [Asticcacaulis machinosus]
MVLTTQTGTPTKTIMLVAAEASGDVLGAGLMLQLATKSSENLRFVGVGGARMEALGLTSPFDIAQLSILGMVEGLKAYKRVKARVADTVALAIAEKPDAVVLIDSWGFTLRVAHGIREAMPEVPLIKYVGPQVWATRPGRAKTLAKSVDFLLALHPMDAPYFEREGLKTVVVGNPALNVDFSNVEPDDIRRFIEMKPDEQMLLVLPGSRPSEIKRLMPVFKPVIERLLLDRPGLKVVLPAAHTVKDLVYGALGDLEPRIHVIEREDLKLSAMKAADVALACSGTVSTELALAGCPMVIAYKVEPLTYYIFKALSSLKYVTLFNIVADKDIAPEYLQKDCTEDNLLKAINTRLDDEVLRQSQIQAQNSALDQMGRGQRPPAELAALSVMNFLNLKGRN